MNFYFPNYSISLDDILAGKINQKFTDSENYILKYVQNWMDGQTQFEFQTSGSTGPPKTVNISRKQLEASARSTLDFLYPTESPKKLLLCINPKFIGGTQVLTRALISKSDITYLEPSSNPLKTLDNFTDLASMVPLQIETILAEDSSQFEKVGTILIGGAPLHHNTQERLKNLNTRFFQTYGMTETASHIALKSTSEESFSFIGGISHRLDNRGCLAVKGTVTNDEWIQTNDVVEFTGNRFKILGRADWVINSGGIKIHPELIEQKIRERFENVTAFVTSIKDERLGEKVVLCCQKSLLEEIKKVGIFSNYDLPKKELIMKSFPLTKTDKIDRKQLQVYAEDILG